MTTNILNTFLFVLASTFSDSNITFPTFKASNTEVILSVEDTNSEKLLATVKDDSFGWSQWQLYQQVEGYKAFAVAENPEGEWQAIGWSEDMVSQYWAVRAAMYVCRFYAYDWPCRVVEVQGPSEEVQLSEQELSGLPEQIMRNKSVEAYYEYQKSRRPKALAMRMPSGIVVWQEASSESVAIDRAMDKCWGQLHESEQLCELVFSHD